MRLINAESLRIHEFVGEDDVPPFAILSHTWGEEECTLQDMKEASVQTRIGYKKIELCCQQALKDGLKWAWIDTCCIDKTSTAELSEAINSMFRWYQKAEICYAYLSDIVLDANPAATNDGIVSESSVMSSLSDLALSRWFTRGWTLQELVAPTNLIFYSLDWHQLGSKVDLQDTLWEITGIDQQVLATGSFEDISLAKKMSWAAKRETTRVEDMAYCLLGIFDVHMPLLYGEGKKAFIRFQEEIMKTSDDQSLFAWGIPAKMQTIAEFIKEWEHKSKRENIGARELSRHGDLQPANWADKLELHNLLADSPADFANSGQVEAVDEMMPHMPPTVTNRGIRLELCIFSIYPYIGIGASEAERRIRDNRADPYFAAISCCVDKDYSFYVGLILVPWSTRFFGRLRVPIRIPAKAVIDRDLAEIKILQIKVPKAKIKDRPVRTFTISDLRGLPHFCFSLDVACAPHATYSQKSCLITLHSQRAGPHAALIFTPKGVHRDYPQADVLPAFAVVLGGLSPLGPHGGPWAITVHLLSEDTVQEGFSSWSLADDSPSKCRMRRCDLLSLLKGEREDRELMLHRSDSVRQMIWRRARERWRYTFGTAKAGFPKIVKGLIPQRERLEIEQRRHLGVAFQVAPTNLIENTIYVRIGLNVSIQDRTPVVSDWWKQTTST